MGKGCVSLTPLKAVDRLHCAVPLNPLNASIDITILLEKTPPSSQKPHPPFQALPLDKETYEQRGQGSGKRAEPQAQLPSSSHPSAKRNLTQSFEDASLATNSSVTG